MQVWKTKMKSTTLWFLTVSTALLVAAGCSKPEPEHHLVPPPKVSDYKVPTTKEEKIAAINKAPMSKEMKQAAIDKVNAGQ
jgi:hypothetical protein